MSTWNRWFSKWYGSQSSIKRRPSRKAAPLAVEELERRDAPAVFSVVNLNNSGAGSLRQAILNANANVGADTINFNIGGAGVRSIAPTSALPALTGPTIVDGTTQPGFTTTPLVEINGLLAGVGVNGLTLSGSGSTVRSLAINHFTGNGIVVPSSNNIVVGSFIGTTADGTAADANGGNGVLITGAGNVIGGTNAADRNVISGNTKNGVLISGAAARNNQVFNARIGLNAPGNAAIANGRSGVAVFAGANGNSIGNTAAGTFNVISGNVIAAVELNGIATINNKVLNNVIGLNAASTTAVANGTGVLIHNGANRNFIGIPGLGGGNLNVGNTLYGIRIVGLGADSNVLQNNTLGGSTLGNGIDAINISGGAKNNTIGSADGTGRNTITRAGRAGIAIQGVGTNGNKVLGNTIGTDPANNTGRGNLIGVWIFGGAKLNVVGSTTTGGHNVISANTFGILIGDAGTTGNIVQANRIGTTLDGSAALANLNEGVTIYGGASANRIGGATSGAGNVISANGNGVSIDAASANTVQNNVIGLSLSGSVDLGNVGDGIRLISKSFNNSLLGNTIGGNDVGVRISGAGSSGNKLQGNFIGFNLAHTAAIANLTGVRIENAATANFLIGNFLGANTAFGVQIHGAGTNGNKLTGNFIGTNVAGSAALPTNNAVFIEAGASSNIIGGTLAGNRNVIVAATGAAVTIIGAGSSNNVVLGNFIGIDAAGTVRIGASTGIFIAELASNNTIGGATPAARNVIAAGATDLFIGNGASGNSVRGNFIGTNAAGNVGLSASDGLRIFDAPNNLVVGNVISGHARMGIEIAFDGSFGNKVQGNKIGVAADGVTPLGNAAQGVHILEFAHDNLIGGFNAGEGNIIAHNGRDGVVIGKSALSGNGPAGSGNAVLGNLIFNNGISVASIGIDLGLDNNVTANDAGDPDTGPNNLQNFPVLLIATPNGTLTAFVGTLDSTPNRTFRIEFFSGVVAGDARKFLGAITVTTSATGKATLLGSLLAVPVGQFVVATATDLTTMDTSEFSAALVVA